MYKMQVIMPDDVLDEYVSMLFTYDIINALKDEDMLNDYINQIVYECIDEGYSEEWCMTDLKEKILEEYSIYDDLEHYEYEEDI